jgi:hypothetical protein
VNGITTLIVYKFLASFVQSDVADRRTEPFSTKYVPTYCVIYKHICTYVEDSAIVCICILYMYTVYEHMYRERFPTYQFVPGSVLPSPRREAYGDLPPFHCVLVVRGKAAAIHSSSLVVAWWLLDCGLVHYLLLAADPTVVVANKDPRSFPAKFLC